jgi:lysophosphatidate acyltransferase
MDFVKSYFQKILKEKESMYAWVYALTAIFTLAVFYSSVRCQSYVRFALFSLSIILCSTWGIIISLYYGIETNYHATKAFARVCEWTIGLKLEVEGSEYLEVGPSIVIYNHQTSLDIVFIGRM